MSSNKKNKNDTFEKFKARYTLVENKRRIKLKVLRIGNGLEFVLYSVLIHFVGNIV